MKKNIAIIMTVLLLVVAAHSVLAEEVSAAKENAIAALKVSLPDAVVDYAVEKLRSYNFLNDGEYAEAYVESVAKRKGGRLIRMELRGKGIAEDEIDAALDTLDGETELATATAILQKYMRGKVCDQVTLQKAYRHLMGKGFDYETAKAALATLGELDED